MLYLMEEVVGMRKAGFDDRLDGILAWAAIRLQERMRLAYFRGNLPEYMERIGLARDLEPELISKGSLLEIQDEAVVLLANKIRYARRAGYLKDFLEQVNMLELLCRERERQEKKARQDKHQNCQSAQSRLRLVEGENKHSADSSMDRELRLQKLRLVK